MKLLKLTAILTIVCCLAISGWQSRARANALGSNLEITAVPIASVAVLALGGYLLWKNRSS